MHPKFEEINNRLILEISQEQNIGLFNGKAGICIYFFHLAEMLGNERYQIFAENLVDDIYKEVTNNKPALNFADGLAGISWSIDYIIQKGFVKGDPDSILSQADDRIYCYIIKNLNHNKLQIGIRKGILGYILYLLCRLNGKKIENTKNDSTLIFKKLLILLINRLSSLIERKEFKLQEPLLFDILWDLPVCLLIISKIKKKGIYQRKIDKILKFLSPIILSLYPRRDTNKLYLIWGIESILESSNMPYWREHVLFLRKNIDWKKLLNKDLQNKNIKMIDGLSGISFISRQLFQLTGIQKYSLSKEILHQKILNSEYWKMIDCNNKNGINLGLMRGVSGVTFELIHLLQISKQ